MDHSYKNCKLHFKGINKRKLIRRVCPDRIESKVEHTIIFFNNLLILLKITRILESEWQTSKLVVDTPAEN